MPVAYPLLHPRRKTGDEPFTNSGQRLPLTVADFWRWGISSLADNITRGVLTEFIVASALDLHHGVRGAWDAYDLRSPSGLRIEVKTSAYLQSWGHHELSEIRFGIKPTRAWDYDTNRMADVVKRQADVYVFCLLRHKDKATLDPLNLDQWDFFVVPTKTLDEKLGAQGTLGLAGLKAIGAAPVAFDGLSAAVEPRPEVRSS